MFDKFFDYIFERKYLSLSLALVNIAIASSIVFINTIGMIFAIILYLFSAVFLFGFFINIDWKRKKSKKKKSKNNAEDEYVFQYIEQGYIPESFQNLNIQKPYYPMDIFNAFDVMDDGFDESLEKFDFKIEINEYLGFMQLAMFLGFTILIDEYSENVQKMFDLKFKKLTKHKLLSLINKLEPYEKHFCKGKMYFYGIKCKQNIEYALREFALANNKKINLRFVFILEFYNLFHDDSVKDITWEYKGEGMKRLSIIYHYKPAQNFMDESFAAVRRKKLNDLAEIERKKQEEIEKQEKKKQEEELAKQNDEKMKYLIQLIGEELNKRNKEKETAKEVNKELISNNNSKKDSSFVIKVAGVSFENRQTIIDLMQVDDVCTLELDRYNAHDSNAVKVLFRNHQIGFIPRYNNGQVAEHLRSGKKYTAKVAAIHGGGNGRYLGVNILINLIN